MAGRPPSRRQANELLRPYPHADRLCRLSFLASLPQSDRNFLNPPRTRKKSRQPVKEQQTPPFRIADFVA